MAKQLHMAVASEAHIPKVIQDGMTATFLRFATMLTASIARRRRRPAVKSYIPGKSREEESRLEFQRFLYW